MAYTLKIRENESRQEIFDPVRRKWVALTPEERVRQIFILYLLNVTFQPGTGRKALEGSQVITPSPRF